MSNRILRSLRLNYDRVQHKRENARLARKFTADAKHHKDALAYAHLHIFSLSMSGTRLDDSVKPSVNLVLPELSAKGIFAGIRTALEFGCSLAEQTHRPLRLISLRGKSNGADMTQAREYVEREFPREDGQRTTVHAASELGGVSVNSNDLWVATHWTTAHALDVAKRLNILRASQVVYLIQDYEPGFSPWSTDHALARSTYHAGFRLVVNSTPLQDYLRKAEGIDVSGEFVFAPSIDVDRLKLASEARVPSSVPRVLFYGRPSKPRNMYAIGLSALYLVADELRRRGVEGHFVSAGEPHQDVQLSDTHTLVSKGKLPWDAYFKLLSNTDVVLCLQASPHPSHPPLDAVAAGCMAVTNEMGGTRAGRHPRLLVAEPYPDALAARLLEAIDAMAQPEVARFDPAFAASLGGSLLQVVGNVVASLKLPLSETTAAATA